MNSLSFILGLFVCCLLFSGCKKSSKERQKCINNEVQDIVFLNNYPDKFFFKGNFKDWVHLRSRLVNDIYPIEIIEKTKKDTIKNVFIEYSLGNYYILSTRFPTRVIVPLLYSESVKTYSDNLLPKEIYDHYKRVYTEQVLFYKGLGRKDYSIKMNFKLIDEITKTYQVIHKEIYQPNFETAPVVTGRRIFTISLKEGAIEYELEGKFEKKWY